MAKPVGFCPRGLPAWARTLGFGQGGMKHRFTLIFLFTFLYQDKKVNGVWGKAPMDIRQ